MAQRLSVASTSTSCSSSSVNHATYIVLHRDQGELGELEDATAVGGGGSRGKGSLGAAAGEQGEGRAHWVRKEVAVRVDTRSAVRERIQKRGKQSGELQRLSEEQQRGDEGRRSSYKATEVPPTAPSPPTTTTKGHSRIRSFFSGSSASKPSLKESISSPRASSPTNLTSYCPSSPIYQPPPRATAATRPRPSHSHSASTPHALPLPLPASAPPTVKFAPIPSPSNSRSPSPVQPKPLSRRPSLPNLGARREREDSAESNKSGGSGGKMGGWLRKTLRSSPSSSSLSLGFTSPSTSPTLVQSPSFSSSSASSLHLTPQTDHGSPTLSIHLPPPSQQTHPDVQPQIKRRPSIPETAFKALSSFALARRESATTGGGKILMKRRSFVREKVEGEEALSDEELRSWRKAGRRQEEGEMEVLEKDEGEETEEEVRKLRRGPSVRRDQALVRERERERSASRGSRRSYSPEQSTDSLTPLATATDSTPRFRFPFGLSLDTLNTSSSTGSSSSPSTNTPPSPTTVSLPDDIALSFLAASGYLERTAPGAEATIPSAPAPRATPAPTPAPTVTSQPVPTRSPPRPRRTTSTCQPSATPSSDSPPRVFSRPTLGGGLQPPPRPAPTASGRMRRGGSSSSTSSLPGPNFSSTSALGSKADSAAEASTNKGRRIISSEAWTQVSLSAQTAGRREERRRRNQRVRKESSVGLGLGMGSEREGVKSDVRVGEEQRRTLEVGTLGLNHRRSGRRASAPGEEGLMVRDGNGEDDKSRRRSPTPPPSPPV